MAYLITNTSTFSSLYGYLLTKALTEGDVVSPRGLKTYELRNVTLELQPDDVMLGPIGRGISPQLMALEALQLVGGFSDPDLTVHVAPNYGQFMDGGEFHGAYGLRTKGKVSQIIDKLDSDQDTRQANMQFWDDDLDLYAGEPKRDYPCTMHANFAVRAGALDMTIVMRSNDLWWGLPYDVFQFTTLQKTVAACLGISPGLYTHIAHSLHLYERNKDEAFDVAANAQGLQFHPIFNYGGIDAVSNSWIDFERRARQITYDDEASLIAENETEAYLIMAANGWRDYVRARDSNG